MLAQEEALLLTIWRLKDNAYGVTIRRSLSKTTGKEWSPGAVYDPLYRMEDKGFVESYLGKPTSERGGKSKRFFRITKRGIDILHEQKVILDEIWDGTSELIYFSTI